MIMIQMFRENSKAAQKTNQILYSDGSTNYKQAVSKVLK